MTTRLADLTTLRVGGPAGRYVEAKSEAEIIEAVQGADADGEPLLVIGGGSNLLVGDEGFPGLVLRDARTDLETPDVSACAGTSLTVAAGAVWDDVVQLAIANRWVGLEALSGIPGSAGATPVQNVGAYGQEVAQTIATVRVWDRARAKVRTLALADLGFGYRTSILKRSMRPTSDAEAWHPTPRYVVLDVTYQLRWGDLSAPIAYGELAARLGVEVGARVPLAEVREAVLELRRGKGMVLDAEDHDTWSAGSFFTNPVLPAEELTGVPAEAPRWSAGPGLTKVSAAWLIEQSGFTKGHGMPGPAALSTKHTLALTNRGDASADDLLALAREVRDQVRSRFGVTLTPEPVVVPGPTL
ncbi:MAG: UDP-N-acetylmuramate dehydrogenase [Actinomycetales bacterium]|nr:UDP-N-acetylmuramate dehydrogenase [Actinomycetales bacterium]